MENIIDDNEAYFRLKPKCSCGCMAHCGHSCMTDDCDCFECACPRCAQEEERIEIGKL
jgi:hypothetical protein